MLLEVVVQHLECECVAEGWVRKGGTEEKRQTDVLAMSAGRTYINLPTQSNTNCDTELGYIIKMSSVLFRAHVASEIHL